MKALDTNVLVRFLVADEKSQAGKVRRLFEAAERENESFCVSWVVLLELIWVLSAAYDFSRAEVLEAIELLSQMPILEFEDHDRTRRLVETGRATTADLSDLLIGLVAQGNGCEATLTFDRKLARTGLFEVL